MGCAKQDLIYVLLVNVTSYLHQLYACDRNNLNVDYLKEIYNNK